MNARTAIALADHHKNTTARLTGVTTTRTLLTVTPRSYLDGCAFVAALGVQPEPRAADDDKVNPPLRFDLAKIDGDGQPHRCDEGCAKQMSHTRNCDARWHARASR